MQLNCDKNSKTQQPSTIDMIRIQLVIFEVTPQPLTPSAVTRSTDRQTNRPTAHRLTKWKMNFAVFVVSATQITLNKMLAGQYATE